MLAASQLSSTTKILSLPGRAALWQRGNHGLQAAGRQRKGDSRALIARSNQGFDSSIIPGPQPTRRIVTAEFEIVGETS